MLRWLLVAQSAGSLVRHPVPSNGAQYRRPAVASTSAYAWRRAPQQHRRHSNIRTSHRSLIGLIGAHAPWRAPYPALIGNNFFEFDLSCTYTIFDRVIVSLHHFCGPAWAAMAHGATRNSCHFIFSTRAASNHLATDCNMSGTYGEPDWATVTSGKADATADAGPTTTSAAAAAASTPSPS